MFPNSLGGHGRSINLASSRQTMRRVPGIPGAGETDAYFKKILALFPLADRVGYWPMSEATGSVAVDYSGRGHNGAYTGVTLNQPGLGDGRGAPLFDGSNDYNNIYSAGLAADFNPLEGTLAAWVKVSGVGVWTDATIRCLFTIQADANNRILVLKSSDLNTMDHYYIAGGTVSYRSLVISSTNWFLSTITWSKSADKVIVYTGSAQVGATLTGLGTWVGALSASQTVLGANSTVPVQVWSGYEAHSVLLNRPATAAEVLSMATV